LRQIEVRNKRLRPGLGDGKAAMEVKVGIKDKVMVDHITKK
jgi:hypothetical protein